MKYIGKVLGYVLLAFNAVLAVLMALSAYSPYFNPQAHPVWSSIGLLFPVFLVCNLCFLVFWLMIYRKFMWLSFAVLLVCWEAVRTYFPINGTGDAVPETAIKILSYNTRAFGMKVPHTKEKSNDVLAYLQKCDADIICLQEYIWGGKLKKKDIDYALRDYRYKHYQPIGKRKNGLGIYSHYPILSAEPITIGNSGYGAVAYRLKVGEDTLLVFNSHLESNRILESDVEVYHDMVVHPEGEKVVNGTWKLLQKVAKATSVRSKQANLLVEKIKQAKGEKIIVCGDFNDTPISYVHRAFHDVLEDAFVETGNGLGFSYNRNRLYIRIDHIFASKNLKVFGCTVDDTTDASDHYPIWCHVTLAEGAD